MMRHESFAVFILSHGRADRIHTLKALEDGNYSGPWYIVIDNEDKTADEYYRRYGDHVIMFDKLAKSKEFDAGDNFEERRAIVFARNACFDIAERMGIEYFLELDDDYTAFHHRFIDGEKLSYRMVKDLDKAFDLMLDFLEDSGAMTVAFAQGGDFIGGKDNQNIKKGLLRKAMNTFFFKTSRRFDFTGKQNEDVTAYVCLGGRGNLFFTATAISIVHLSTQSEAGGMTELYVENGTYLKSFYTVMYCPSCVKVAMMGESHKRLHHQINWRHAVPKIIEEKWRKSDE